MLKNHMLTNERTNFHIPDWRLVVLRHPSEMSRPTLSNVVWLLCPDSVLSRRYFLRQAQRRVCAVHPIICVREEHGTIGMPTVYFHFFFLQKRKRRASTKTRNAHDDDGRRLKGKQKYQNYFFFIILRMQTLAAISSWRFTFFSI